MFWCKRHQTQCIPWLGNSATCLQTVSVWLMEVFHGLINNHRQVVSNYILVLFLYRSKVAGLWASGVWLETVDVSFCGCRRQQICFLFIQSHTDDWESYSCFMDVLKHQTASTTTGSNICWLLSPAAIPSCPALNHSSYFENNERWVYEKKKRKIH